MAMFTDIWGASISLPWRPFSASNTADDGKPEPLIGTAANAFSSPEKTARLGHDEKLIEHTNSELQSQDKEHETLSAAFHDLPAEPLPTLPRSTTSPGKGGISGYHLEDPTRQQTSFASIPTSLSSGASPEFTMSDGASTNEPRAEEQADPSQAQNWRYIREAFRSMSEKHKAIVATRIRVREERNSLRRQRENVIDLDIRVASGLRDLFNKRPTEEISSLLALFEQLQRSRDELLQQEDDYNIMEDDLIGDEFDLQEVESRIFPGLPSGGSSFVDDKDITTYLEGLEHTEPDGGDGAVIHPPEMTQYFSRMGDADIIQESLDELRRERAHIVEEERVRARLGLTLDKESQDFLNQFDHRHNELQDQLARVQEDLIKLQESLASDGDVVYASSQFGNYNGPLDQAMDELEPLGTSDPDLLFPVVSFSFSTLPPFSSTPQKIVIGASTRSTDSLLLPDEDSSPVFPSPAGTSKPGSIGTAEYINDWLLDMLRRSPREIQRLKSLEKFQQLQLNQVQLAESVLGRWLDDEEAMNDLEKQELGARSLYISSNAVAESARISKTLSLPALATVPFSSDGLRRLNAPLRRSVGTTFAIQQHDRQSETDSSVKALSMYEFQARLVSVSVPRHFREAFHVRI